MSKKGQTIKELLPGISATTYHVCANREGRIFNETAERINNKEDTSDLKPTSMEGPVKMGFIALRDFYAGTLSKPPWSPKFRNFCEGGCKLSLCEYHSK